MNLPRRLGLGLVALVLLAGCRSPEPSVPTTADPEVRRLAAAARRVWELGEPAKAIPLYRDALARARSLDDAPAIAATAGSLAVCLYDLGDAQAAAASVREALAAAERARHTRADLWVLEGRIRLALGAVDEAQQAAAQSLAERASPETRAGARLLLAQVAMARTNSAAAAQSLDDARRELPPGASPALRAWAAETEAALRELEGDPRGAARAWLEAAHWRGRASQAARVARALLAASRAFEHAGARLDAADAAVRAARALAATRPNEARALLDRAAELLGDAEAPAVRDGIAALRRELAAENTRP